MSDERFNQNPEEQKAAPEVFEEFLEEQAKGEEDIAPEPEEKEQEVKEPEVAETTPPAWQDNPINTGGARINMQVKKKKRKWLAPLIIGIVAFYVLLTVLLAVGVFRAVRDLNIGYDIGSGRFEANVGKDSLFNKNEPDMQEHLQISPTPDQEEEVQSADGKLTVKQISKKVRKSVVGVVAEGSMNFSSSSVGSGIIMSADGYVITNNHVIEGMSKISVVTDDGKTYSAYVIGTDSRTDLAVLKVDAKDLPVAEFGDSDKLEQGDLAVAIGNPAGIQLQNTVTSGIISAINRNIVVEDQEMTLIQTDASINPGNSGGPLVNEYGQVIGINTVKIGVSYYEGLGFAIPINTAKPIIDELISRGYVRGRPSIGISGQAIGEREAAFYSLKPGMYVEFVHPYSDAYKKGLQAGDVITAMNGTPLTSSEEIKKIRDQHKAGDTVKLTIFRNGREFNLDVVLMDEAELDKIGQPTNSRS